MCKMTMTEMNEKMNENDLKVTGIFFLVLLDQQCIDIFVRKQLVKYIMQTFYIFVLQSNCCFFF